MGLSHSLSQERQMINLDSQQGNPQKETPQKETHQQGNPQKETLHINDHSLSPVKLTRQDKQNEWSKNKDEKLLPLPPGMLENFFSKSK